MARRMVFPAGLMILIVALVQVHEACSANDSHDHHCPASSCGNIHNISYPFRLNGDPAICGDPRYNLSCENNQTVLYLYDGRFYVQEIDYNNYTIRLVDSGIQKDNDSFIPRYSLGLTNFSSGDPYSVADYPWEYDGGCFFRQFPYWTEMVFVNCEKQVKSPIYLDISTCLKNGEVYSSNSFLSHSKRYTYVIPYSRIRVEDFEESCQIEKKSLQTTDRWETRWPNRSFRYFGCTDFYDAVVSGFMLSWFQGACDYHNFTDFRCHTSDYYLFYDGVFMCSRSAEHWLKGLFLKLLRICAKALVAVIKLLVSRTIRDKFGIASDISEYDSEFENLKRVLGSMLYYVVPYSALKLVLGTPCVIAFLIYKWRRRHLSMYDIVEEFLQSHNNLMPIRER